ncbi:hypothetical protein JOC55_005580, partial [Paenibacillus sacheonensis]|nr:hypothetical protein [Paenibacillus sacheonensis]
GLVYADRTGIHRTIVGELPAQCAALNMTNINVQRLAVMAAKSGDPETVVQAIALDPLTSSVLTLKEIRDMVTEMLDAESEWLPQFGNRRPRPTPTIQIPQDVKRADVPNRPGARDLRPPRRAGTVTPCRLPGNNSTKAYLFARVQRQRSLVGFFVRYTQLKYRKTPKRIIIF